MCNGGSYAKGGSVHGKHSFPTGLKGIHEPTTSSPGESYAGNEAREAKEFNRTASKEEGISSGGYHESLAKSKHERVLGEMKSMPKPKLYAEGGDVGEVSAEIPLDDESVDHELNETMGHELMEAIHMKDKKRIMEAVEAVVLSCMARKDRHEGEM